MIMRHVGEIENLIANGQMTEALTALEELLEFGPHNIKAIRLKALIFGHQGRFAEEFSCWAQVIELETENTEANEFFLQKQIEEQEQYYFTDRLPEGWRYFGNPRAMVSASILGLAGCLLFLLCGHVGTHMGFLPNPKLASALFVLLVVTPWIGVLYAYMKALREVLIDEEGIRFVSRTAEHAFRWRDLQGIQITNSQNLDEDNLQVQFVPRDQNRSVVKVNISRHNSAIRARTFFLDQLANYFGSLHYTTSADLLSERPAVLIT